MTAIELVLFNHWEADAEPVIVEILNKARPGDNFDFRWYAALGAAPDQSAAEAAVLRVLPFIQDASDFVIKKHWDLDARSVVLAALASARANDRFTNPFISIAAEDPKAPGVKEAILHVLPQNEEAIDFVAQHHWEVEAEPILLRKMSVAVLAQNVNPKWIKALATTHDAKVYPLLLDYTRKQLISNHNWSSLDDIRSLPGALVTELAGQAWNVVRGHDEEIQALQTAASWGFSDALDRSAAILSEPREPDNDKLRAQESRKAVAREALTATTSCPERLLNMDLAAWWKDHKTALGYDPLLERFVHHPQPAVPEKSWPSVADTMKALGQRAEEGDGTAFDELETAMNRLTEGLDPKTDAARIKALRNGVASDAFEVLRNDVAQKPKILALLDPANRQAELRPFVVGVFGQAVRQENQKALQALLNYQAHQWNLSDVVGNLNGAIYREEPSAIAFEGNLPNDPNCTAEILDHASDQLFNTANDGNVQAQAAYRAVLRARSLR